MLDQVPRHWIGIAQAVTHQLMEDIVLDHARTIRLSNEPVTWDFQDIYGAVQLATLEAVTRYRRSDARSLQRRLRRVAFWAMRRELRRQWYLPDIYIPRWREIEEARGWVTPDLLPPRGLHEVVDADPSALAFLVDDIPDPTGVATGTAAFSQIRAKQMHRLLERLPRRFRGPVWRVHGLEEDEFTAGRHLGLRLPVCWALAREGLSRLQQMVADDPSLLLPLND